MADITLTFAAIGAEKVAAEIKKIQDSIKGAMKGFDSTGADALKSAAKQASGAASDLQSSLDAASDAAEEAAGELEVLDDNAEDAADSLGKLEKSSKKSEGSMMSFGKAAGAVVTALKALVVVKVAKAGFDFLTEGIMNAFKAGQEFSKMAAALGIDAGSARLLGQAFTEAGMSAESVVPMISKMQRKIAEGSAAFEALGLDVEALKGKSAVEQMDMLGEAVRKVGDQEGRMKVLMAIFEEAGPQLSKFFNNPQALDNASRTLGSSVQIMRENAEAFDRAAVLISNVSVKIGTFFEGVAAGIVEPLSSLLEGLNGIDLAEEGRKFGDAIGRAVKVYYKAFTNGQLFELLSLKLGSVAAAFVQTIWSGFQWVANRLFAVFSAVLSASFDMVKQSVSDENSWVSRAMRAGAYVGGPVAGGRLDGFDLSGAQKKKKTFGDFFSEGYSSALADAERAGKSLFRFSNFFGNLSEKLKSQGDMLYRSIERSISDGELPWEKRKKKEGSKVEISKFDLDVSGLLGEVKELSSFIPQADSLMRVGGSIRGMTDVQLAPARKTADNTSRLVNLTNEIRSTLKARPAGAVAVYA